MNQGIQVRLKQHWQKHRERLDFLIKCYLSTPRESRREDSDCKDLQLNIICLLFFQFECPAIRMLEVCGIGECTLSATGLVLYLIFFITFYIT